MQAEPRANLSSPPLLSGHGSPFSSPSLSLHFCRMAVVEAHSPCPFPRTPARSHPCSSPPPPLTGPLGPQIRYPPSAPRLSPLHPLHLFPGRALICAAKPHDRPLLCPHFPGGHSLLPARSSPRFFPPQQHRGPLFSSCLDTAPLQTLPAGLAGCLSRARCCAGAGVPLCGKHVSPLTSQGLRSSRVTGFPWDLCGVSPPLSALLPG